MSQPTHEQWRPVVGYEGRYEVSDHGRVRGLDRRVRTKGGGMMTVKGRVLAPAPNGNGHPAVSLHREGVSKTWKVHTLVLEAFVGPRPEGMGCRHLDSNPENNHLSNLCWGTQTENMKDMTDAGRHHNQVRTHCPQGHEYTPENVYRIPSRPNARYCRACNRERSAERSKMQKLQRMGASA